MASAQFRPNTPRSGKQLLDMQEKRGNGIDRGGWVPEAHTSQLTRLP